jgi:hypothetical protein
VGLKVVTTLVAAFSFLYNPEIELVDSDKKLINSISTYFLHSMNAKEARKLAEAAQTGKLDEIYAAISKAAKEGEYVTHVYFSVDPKDQDTLKNDGYIIEVLQDPESIIFEISWGPNPYLKAANELNDTMRKIDTYNEEKKKKKPWWNMF